MVSGNILIGTKYYYVCESKRQTDKSRPGEGKKVSRKFGKSCISRMYCTKEPNGNVTVDYIQTHTNALSELKHIPLPATTKEQVENKIAMDLPIPRIIKGIYKMCDACLTVYNFRYHGWDW